MDIIKSYLDQCFARLPQTPETLRMKNELLSTMEDKYHELKAAGKAENEAIGIVISEFGNIDELYAALDLPGGSAGEAHGSGGRTELPELSLADAARFMEAKIRGARLIAIGVLLCVLAPAALILFAVLLPEHSISGLVALFCLIAVAVPLFIWAGTGLAEFEHLEKSRFRLSPEAQAQYKAQMNDYRPRWTAALIVAVSFFILSPLTVILSSNSPYAELGPALLLALVALGACLCVRFGVVMGAYHILLQLEDYAPEKKESSHAVGILASIWWPCATAVFLIWGFAYNGWGRAWIVWPIAGVLFGVVSAVVSAVTKKPQSNL